MGQYGTSMEIPSFGSAPSSVAKAFGLSQQPPSASAFGTSVFRLLSLCNPLLFNPLPFFPFFSFRAAQRRIFFVLQRMY